MLSKIPLFFVLKVFTVYTFGLAFIYAYYASKYTHIRIYLTHEKFFCIQVLEVRFEVDCHESWDRFASYKSSEFAVQLDFFLEILEAQMIFS